MPTTRFVSLQRYAPTGLITPDHFALSEGEIGHLEPGEVLLRPLAFSVDPALRTALYGTDNVLAPAVPLGAPITGFAAAEVVQSENPSVKPGDIVSAYGIEWADLAIWPPRQAEAVFPQLDRIPTSVREISHAVGVFSSIGGLTAYAGMIGAGRVQPGEVVVVSAAAGNVGSVAGQIAALRGATVIGLAGTESKRRILTERLGFAAALDYRAADLAAQILTYAPAGPDLYFDNVGGHVSQIVMGLMRHPGRIVECGQIASLGDPDSLMVDTKPIVLNGLTLHGFTVQHYADLLPAALDDLIGWVNSGRLIPLETRWHGLEQLPAAFAGLFLGENVGKMVVLTQ
ncbi:MDR family NADP-dependent oxidoreductase [Mycobacterium kyogaense]|uniref:MDR family NADP-dependent oxidoreductase n=1 Tax=Mycobacterium kyogaense TaxID=2212479 RepID=UPI000DAD48D5|nr:NADP-dependent oxidoreductase [Mycobacterium kyogaense]